jgi:hypothetical protein
MNISTRTGLAGATTILGLLLAVSACGTETVADTDPGAQPVVKARVYPPTSVPVWTPGPKHGPMSADAAERRAAQEKARQDRASTLRWDRGAHQENKLGDPGHPGRP